MERKRTVREVIELENRWAAMAYKPGRVGLNVIRLRGLLAGAEERAYEMTGDPARVIEAMEDFEREILSFVEMKAAVLAAMPRAYVLW